MASHHHRCQASAAAGGSALATRSWSCPVSKPPDLVWTQGSGGVGVGGWMRVWVDESRAGQKMSRQGQTERGKARQGKARQGSMAWHRSMACHGRGRRSEARQSKAKQGSMDVTDKQTDTQLCVQIVACALAAHVRADRFIECAWRSRCACVRSHRCLVLSLRVCVRADRFIE